MALQLLTSAGKMKLSLQLLSLKMILSLIEPLEICSYGKQIEKALSTSGLYRVQKGKASLWQAKGTAKGTQVRLASGAMRRCMYVVVPDVTHMQACTHGGEVNSLMSSRSQSCPCCFIVTAHDLTYLDTYIYIQVEPGKPGAEVSKNKNYKSKKEFAYRMCTG